MKYLLDTCVISDFVKGETGTLKKIKSLPPNEVVISTITVMEIQYGLALSPERTKRIKQVIYDFVNCINVLDFNHDDAKEAAIVRAFLKRQGCPIGSYDILLAGTALNRKLILVSANMGEFNRIDGLNLENWRSNQR